MTFLRHVALALLAMSLLVAPVTAQTPDDRQFDRVIESLTNLDGPKLSAFFDHIGITPSPDFYECLCPAEYGFHHHVGPEGSCRRIGPLGGVEFRGFDMPRMKSCSVAFPLADGRTVLQAIVLAARPTCSIGPEAALGAPLALPGTLLGRAELMLAVTGDPPPAGPLSTADRDRVVKGYLYGMFAEIDYDSCGTFGRWYSDYGPQIQAALCLALGVGSSTNPASVWGAGRIIASCLLDAAKDQALAEYLGIVANLLAGTDRYVLAFDQIFAGEDWKAVDGMSEEERRKWFEKRGAELIARDWGSYVGSISIEARIEINRRWGTAGSSPLFTPGAFTETYGDGWANNSGKGDQLTLPAYILLRLWQLHQALGTGR